MGVKLKEKGRKWLFAGAMEIAWAKTLLKAVMNLISRAAVRMQIMR